MAQHVKGGSLLVLGVVGTRIKFSAVRAVFSELFAKASLGLDQFAVCLFICLNSELSLCAHRS